MKVKAVGSMACALNFCISLVLNVVCKLGAEEAKEMGGIADQETTRIHKMVLISSHPYEVK